MNNDNVFVDDEMELQDVIDALGAQWQRGSVLQGRDP